MTKKTIILLFILFFGQISFAKDYYCYIPYNHEVVNIYPAIYRTVGGYQINLRKKGQENISESFQFSTSHFEDSYIRIIYSKNVKRPNCKPIERL